MMMESTSSLLRSYSKSSSSEPFFHKLALLSDYRTYGEYNYYDYYSCMYFIDQTDVPPPIDQAATADKTWASSQPTRLVNLLVPTVE